MYLWEGGTFSVSRCSRSPKNKTGHEEETPEEDVLIPYWCQTSNISPPKNHHHLKSLIKKAVRSAPAVLWFTLQPSRWRYFCCWLIFSGWVTSLDVACLTFHTTIYVIKVCIIVLISDWHWYGLIFEAEISVLYQKWKSSIGAALLKTCSKFIDLFLNWQHLQSCESPLHLLSSNTDTMCKTAFSHGQLPNSGLVLCSQRYFLFVRFAV